MATVRAQVIEGLTGEPLPNASVMLVDSAGNNLHVGVMADMNGKFTLTSDVLFGNSLLISYTGLASLIVPVSTLNDTDFTEIDLYPKDLQAVVVTPAANSSNWWLWLILGGVLLYGFSKSKSNGR